MAYSSIAQLRMNLTLATLARIDDATVTDRIAHSDDDVDMDLGKYVDMTNAIIVAGYATTNFPVWLNHLSQYKTCEHVLIKLYGEKRQGDDVSDIDYWRKQYDGLLDRIRTNQVLPVLGNGTSIGLGQFDIKVGRSTIDPPLGEGDYGEFEPESDIEIDRPRS